MLWEIRGQTLIIRTEHFRDLRAFRANYGINMALHKKAREPVNCEMDEFEIGRILHLKSEILKSQIGLSNGRTVR
jgi:hypothetical protein